MEQYHTNFRAVATVANVRLCHIAHNPLSDQFGMDINTPFTKLLLLRYHSRLCHIAHNPLSDQFGMNINTPFTKLLLLCYPEKPSLLDSSIPYKGNLVGCGAHSDFGDKFTTTPGGVINLCYGCME